MPKIGMEPIRRKALIGAAIAEIGSSGSLDVTVGKIARRAGVSSALAHHYFGGKDDLLLAAMRHLLVQLWQQGCAGLKVGVTPRQRLSNLVQASFTDAQFAPATISAWLNFYVRAQSSPPAARLLNIYVRRLHSNLAFDLRRLMPESEVQGAARDIAALIDGIYLRQALHAGAANEAVHSVETFIDRLVRPNGS